MVQDLFLIMLKRFCGNLLCISFIKLSFDRIVPFEKHKINYRMSHQSDIDIIDNIIIDNSDKISEEGLLKGRMGVILFFYKLYKKTGNDRYVCFAEYQVDLLTEKVEHITIEFGGDLSGIGWGIEYLIQNQFVDGDADDILQDIDSYILREFMKPGRTLLDIDDVAYYFYQRLVGKKGNSTIMLRYFIIHVLDLIDARLEEMVQHPNMIKDILSDFTLRNPFLFTLWILKAYHPLEIFNFRIERLIETILHEILNSQEIMHPGNELFLLLILEKMQGLTFKKKEIQTQLDLLINKSSINALKIQEKELSREQILQILFLCKNMVVYKKNFRCIYENSLRNIHVIIEDMRKEQKYGILNGLSGLGLILLDETL